MKNLIQTALRKSQKLTTFTLAFRLPRIALYIALLMAMLQLGGCASLGVQPWERGLLAKDEMALDAQSIDLGLDDHIYFSKEAASGGRAFAGGGCGCN